MNLLLWNVLLALIWAFIMSDVTARGLAVGFVIGYLVLLFSRPLFPETRYFSKLFRAVALAVFFVVELLKSSVRVAIDVLHPDVERRMEAAVFSVPLDVKSDLGISLLANLISLTPGTLSLDVSEDRSTLFIHGMYVDDVEAARREIKEGFERRIMEVFQ
ncbi:MAG: Na+/H+ antiporter subunit E [Deltaproteobacteria bacterium]|nr:MAG: Na+/H+ antiporter subunit E [Deltaproteobacteria bacterium]